MFKDSSRGVGGRAMPPLTLGDVIDKAFAIVFVRCEKTPECLLREGCSVSYSPSLFEMCLAHIRQSGATRLGSRILSENGRGGASVKCTSECLGVTSLIWDDG